MIWMTQLILKSRRGATEERSLAAKPAAVLARTLTLGSPELHKLIIGDIIDAEVRDLVSTSAKSIADAGSKGRRSAAAAGAPDSL